MGETAALYYNFDKFCTWLVMAGSASRTSFGESSLKPTWCISYVLI